MFNIKHKIDLFLLEVVFRIARHWGCQIHISKTKTKNGAVKWIKFVFPN